MIKKEGKDSHHAMSRPLTGPGAMDPYVNCLRPPVGNCQLVVFFYFFYFYSFLLVYLSGLQDAR